MCIDVSTYLASVLMRLRTTQIAHSLVILLRHGLSNPVGYTIIRIGRLLFYTDLMVPGFQH